MGTPTGAFLDHYLPYVLRRADQTLSAPFYAVLHAEGVARSEWRVLAVLAEHGEISIAQVVEAALSPQPTVTHAIRRLEDRGLISRVNSEHDRRQRMVSLTDEGTRLTDRLVRIAHQLETRALAQFGDVRSLISQLEELTEAIVAAQSQDPDFHVRSGT